MALIPLSSILLLFIIQLSAYILLDKYKLGNWKYAVFIVSLILTFFVLPRHYIPENIKCGMPGIAITYAFWMIGGGLTFLTLIVYLSVKLHKSRKQNHTP